MQKPTIAVIGPGRAGSALGRALHKAGYTIAAIGGRNPDNVRNLAAELGARACQSPATTIDLADLTILAVPDDVILPLASDMADSLCSAAGRSVVHLSGAQDRKPLRPLAQQAGLLAGVFNNLQDLAPADAITGPASRGDEGTIQKHLAALQDDPAAQRLYQLLADRTKLLARKKNEEAA